MNARVKIASLLLGIVAVLAMASVLLANKIEAADPATCSLTSNQDAANPFLYHTTLVWSGAHYKWHLFYWGDEAQTGNGPVGYFGTSGSASWDHIYNPGTWQQWSNLSGPGGGGSCDHIINAQLPPQDPATCTITTNPDANNPLVYHTTISWRGTYDNWTVFHWGDEEITGAQGPGFFGKSGTASWDHEYIPGTWEQWANLNGPGGAGSCKQVISAQEPPQAPQPVCNITTSAYPDNPLLYTTTLVWENGYDGWHLFHWGDEEVSGAEGPGYFGPSGSISWDHLYTPGTWQQWTNLEGPGGWGGCLQTITAQ